jgi:RNA polymerase sigma-70 factor, ECF subfamily
MALDKIGNTGTGGLRRTVSFEELSDHELMEATKNGDEAAFGEIVRRYQTPLINYLYRMLYDYDEAVDLAQETFVRVYLAIERYHPGYSFTTYIYRIASNLAISEIRRRKARRLMSLTGLFQYEGDEQSVFQPPDENPLADDVLIENQERERIENAIAALPDRYRMPIILREIEEMTYEEVADVLDLGLGTIKSRISRGRKLLRKKMRKHFKK